MTQMVEANISVNGDYQANYDLVVYANNPFIENRGTVLGTAFVVSGSTAKFSFSAPSSLIVVYVALKDEKGYTYLKPAVINDGKLETSFGGNVILILLITSQPIAIWYHSSDVPTTHCLTAIC